GREEPAALELDAHALTLRLQSPAGLRCPDGRGGRAAVGLLERRLGGGEVRDDLLDFAHAFLPPVGVDEAGLDELASERCQVAAAVRVGGRGRLADLVREAVPGGAVAAGPLIEGGEPLHHLDTGLAVPLLAGFGLGRRELGAGDGLRPRPETTIGCAGGAPEGLREAP